jgi:DNA-binding CsgD family transcriptional regulator
MAPVGPDVLTPREAEVMELLQGGRSNAEIAAALHVSIETVRTHARRIYRKLGVRTRRELLARR